MRAGIRRWEKAIAAVALAVAAVVLYTRDPEEPGSYPLCPLNAVTGLYCPGCGSLRAAHQLLHGNVSRGFSLNPLAVLAVPFMAYHLAVWLVPAVRPIPRESNAIVTWLLLATVVAFGVLRNLPWEPLSSLAP